jgi:hypothetical protein
VSQNNIIYQKLDFFITKFYQNELLKGLLFLVGLGLLFLYVIIFVEFYLWLGSFARTCLFVVFIAVELLLLGKYILWPLLKLSRIKSGLDAAEAANIIGKHFAEVSDKLSNLLQLSQTGFRSELLEASIAQKTDSLKLIPFQNAISFTENKKYVPLVIVPVFMYICFVGFGYSAEIANSFGRVLSFKKQFIRPAPFYFKVLNNSFEIKQGNDFVVVVETVGKVAPDNILISFDGESYAMAKDGNGSSTFVFKNMMKNVNFFVSANGVQSHIFEIDVIEVPAITDFKMRIQFPSYLGRKTEVITGSGNAVVPEGSIVSWSLSTVATSMVVSKIGTHVVNFDKFHDRFKLSTNITETIQYQIIISNINVANYEVLDYKIVVVKDLPPFIEGSIVTDSLSSSNKFIVGKCGDDYGLTKLQIVYYPSGKVNSPSRGSIALKSFVNEQFVFSFPGSLPVKAGVVYDFYFEVFDNDAVHGFKSAKSVVFSDAVMTDLEKQEANLFLENQSIDGMSQSVKQSEKQLVEIDKLQKMSKENENFDFNEQKRVEDFVKKQEKQNRSIKKFAEDLKENFIKNKENKNDDLRKELEKRLENQLMQLQKNEKFLEQLNALNSKLMKEELTEQLEKFKQSAKNQTKNLEQLVELTKRFYVEKKLRQTMELLDKLSEKQEKLADDDLNNIKKNQEEINKEFSKVQESLKDLKKENSELKAPLDVPNDVDKEKSIGDDLKNAVDELQKDPKDGKQKAKPKQKGAAKKMKEMSRRIQESMDRVEIDQLEEDVAMLRQILDNLLSFSFSEEVTMSQFKSIKRNAPSYNKILKLQQDLRLQFQHVDDSLFALGLRNPKISEIINNEVGNVHYNINKAVEVLVESNVSKGIFHQQYAVSSANKLADMLSETLNNMQMSMQSLGSGKPKKGKGKGSSMQLPDIIKKQDGISKKLDKQKQSGSKPGNTPGDGKENKAGEDGKGGKSGDGKEDGEGNSGEILKIYQEQRQLREALQNELNSKGLGAAGQSVLDQMKQLEKQLLNKGFKNEILQKSLNIKQELLKLEKAVQEQGHEERRQAEGSAQQFQNKATEVPAAVRNYLNSIEILNKQPLPMNFNHEQRTKLFFNNK